MAHEFESGMFVKEEAWHKQGVVVENAPTTDEAIEIAGMNWNVNLIPSFIKVGDKEIATGEYAIVRDKDNSVFGNVGERYVPYQNKQAFDWCKPLVETTDFFKMESAGSLKGGHICWALLKADEAEVVANDKLKNYLLITWSHDGTKSVQVTPTTIRVVCNNTLQMALNSSKSSEISKVRHTTNIVPKLEQVRKIHEATANAFKEQQDAFKRLLDKKIETPEEFVDRVLREAFGASDNLNNMKEGRGKTILLNTREALLNGAVNGSGIKEQGIGNTLYGAFNGVSEVIEHSIGGNRVKDRGYNVLFGNGKQYINKAFDIACQMANA